MKSSDLEEKFTHKPVKEKSPSDVEDIRLFFKKRLISNKKIADELEVQPQQVGHWFNGRQATPPKRKAELNVLMQRFIDWEKVHGRIFNGEHHKVIPKQDEVIDMCPYNSDGAKFGLHFNFYRECETCNLFKECETWSEAHPTEYKQSIEDNQE